MGFPQQHPEMSGGWPRPLATRDPPRPGWGLLRGEGSEHAAGAQPRVLQEVGKNSGCQPSCISFLGRLQCWELKKGKCGTCRPCISEMLCLWDLPQPTKLPPPHPASLFPAVEVFEGTGPSIHKPRGQAPFSHQPSDNSKCLHCGN